ncbi:branched-chain amino acid ABC transporter permease [Brevibacillus humidisoli]|uniref:branched-chain amino acid ABC transporter permease n=1 Tax=Brevibacillus humidisoli TaxID=2895522 RepID=UPI001E4C7EDB|nr:branched-chain amino acid ABC transporter permease [Brevibacillus humidisoli]UFJ39435.1 branched-chain amino acid ABC transporter permease [Brevibacillus humidisoli]
MSGLSFPDLLQLLFSGIAVGGIYALISVGFVTIYNVNGVINFAQGEFVMVAGMIGATLATTGLPLWLACLLAVGAAGLVGAVVQRVALHPARYSSEVVLIIITIGLSIMLRGIALFIWGSNPRTLPAFFEGEPFTVLGAAVPRQDIVVVIIAVLSMLLLYLFFERTYMGTALRACMINKEVSRLMGISPEKMALLSLALGASLAGVVGVVVTPISLATPEMGLMIGLKGFVAATLGGLTSIPGAVLGGLLLGVLESLGAGLISSGYKDAIAFFLLILLLVLRPQGILGGRSAKRV